MNQIELIFFFTYETGTRILEAPTDRYTLLADKIQASHYGNKTKVLSRRDRGVVMLHTARNAIAKKLDREKTDSPSHTL